MSAQFAIRYAGAGVRKVNGRTVLGTPEEVDVFVSEADAWLEAFRMGLPPHNTTVVNLYTEQQQRN